MKLINSDCIATMKAMPDNFIDSIVTDPPYELGFMGKSWDSTGIAFNVEVWTEALRVLKPGGHLIAFSGSRTYHRMAVAIEDAGFEIRDQIMWVYGSGFPKSMNISKALDRAVGAEREVIGERKQRANSENSLVPMNASVDEVEYITAPATEEAKQWNGWGTALKPAHEPMVLARKPLIGTVANNVLTYGVGGLNIDASRVGSELMVNPPGSTNPRNSMGDGWREDAEPTTAIGRWPANFIHDGSDEVVALFPDSKSSSGKKQPNNTNNEVYSGTWDAQPDKISGFDDSGSAARFFYCAKTSKRDRNEGLDDSYAKQMDESRKAGSKGGNNPRNRGANERVNHHPTVKPTSLMQYLVRLVTPTGGTVLDPFMGSGSTGKACAYEGFDFIGIDMTPEYVEIAKARIEFAVKNKSSELDL